MGSLLFSSQPIIVDATFDALTCDSTKGILGQAAPRMAANFLGAPLTETYYPFALADALVGENISERNSATAGLADIVSAFNSRLDTDGTCLGAKGFYYGYDHNYGSNVDFVSVALHEIAHGLGFLSSINAATGVAQTVPTTGAEIFGAYVDLSETNFSESYGQLKPRRNERRLR